MYSHDTISLMTKTKARSKERKKVMEVIILRSEPVHLVMLSSFVVSLRVALAFVRIA